jgi:hypothetical protein
MFGNSIKGSPGQTFSVIWVVHFKTSHFPVLVLALVGASSLKNILIKGDQDWIWLAFRWFEYCPCASLITTIQIGIFSMIHLMSKYICPMINTTCILLWFGANHKVYLMHVGVCFTYIFTYLCGLILLALVVSHLMSNVFQFLFLFFFFPILWCSWSRNHPYDDLARFGTKKYGNKFLRELRVQSGYF